jgi:hypothetical protein
MVIEIEIGELVVFGNVRYVDESIPTPVGTFRSGGHEATLTDVFAFDDFKEGINLVSLITGARAERFKLRLIKKYQEEYEASTRTGA